MKMATKMKGNKVKSSNEKDVESFHVEIVSNVNDTERTGSIVYTNSIFGHRKIQAMVEKEMKYTQSDKWNTLINCVQQSYGSSRRVVDTRDKIHRVEIVYSISPDKGIAFNQVAKEFISNSSITKMLDKEKIPYTFAVYYKVKKTPNIVNAILSFDITVSPKVMKVKRLYKVSETESKEFVFWLDKNGYVIKTEIKSIEVLASEERAVVHVEKIEAMMDKLADGAELIESHRFDHNS